MKNILKKGVVWFLRRKARKVLQLGATVIAVTGSMGKTTTKDAIVKVLNSRFQVLASVGGFNTEIGILLTLLGETESGFASAQRWLQILWRILFRKTQIPEYIVLEYGVDHPGDMQQLLDIIQPKIAVVTNIAPVHLGPGQFSDEEDIAREKSLLPQSIGPEGKVLLNIDNPLVRKMQDKISAPVISYGTAEDAEYRISELRCEKTGISFSVIHDSETTEYSLSFFGTFHAHIVLPAIILGEAFGITLKESAAILRTFLPPPGRGRILPGINGSTIWDSSYNSAPAATSAALIALPELPGKRKLALLGHMNELGERSAEYHQELGRTAAFQADEIFYIGTEAESFAQGVAQQKLLTLFPDAESAGLALQKILKPDDLLLVKGSQNGVFLERAIKKILANPEDTKLLCRQSAEWEGKK